MNGSATVVSFVLLTLSLSLLATTTLSAHPGGRDRYGCHHDRKRGGYHCHAGPLAGQSFASQADMLAVLQGQPQQPLAPSSSVKGTLPSTAPTESGAPEQVCIREHRTQQIMCGEPVR